MKTAILTISTLFLFFVFSYTNTSHTASLTMVDNIPFFDGSTFTLQYFWVNGAQEDLELQLLDGSFYNPQSLEFTFNTTTNQLDMLGGLYCNGISGNYNYTDTHLEITNGGTTLADCEAGSQELRYLFIVNPLFDASTTNSKVFYEITADQKGLWLWGDNVNEKLFFTKDVLNIDKQNLNKLVQIYPNPAQEFITIEVNNISISKVSIFDIQGKQVLSKDKDYNRIDISNLSKGLYFVKIKTTSTTITKKIIIN